MEILSKKKTTLPKRNLSPKTCRDWSLFSGPQISAQKQQTFQIVFIKQGNSLKEKNNSSKTQFESQDKSRLELVFSSPNFGAEATNVSNCFYKTWKFSQKTTLPKRNLSPKTCRDWRLFSALQFSAQKQQTFPIVFIKHGNSLKEKNNSSKTQFESQDMSRLELVFSSPNFGAEATNVSNCFYKTWKFSQRKKQLFQNAI